MDTQRFLNRVDRISTWAGKLAAWLIIGLMTVVCVEVFKRYILNAPTAFIYDINNMLYGTLFMMCGAYTLAQNAHVRGDFLYSSMRPRTQASLDLVLYLMFFHPWNPRADVRRLRLRRWTRGASASTPTSPRKGPPVYQFKAIIPIAGTLVMLQGLAEIMRCVVCLKTGQWPERLKDAEEIDVVEQQLATSDVCRRGIAASGRSRMSMKSTTRRASAHSGWQAETREAMSDPALGLMMLTLIVIVIMLGFPTAFTLMGLGMLFGYIAFYDPSQAWSQNRVFDLIVERTYGAMNNESLISIPLFVLMGYVMERGALVDKMFYSIQLAFRGVPASLAVATLIVCTFWGIASGTRRRGGGADGRDRLQSDAQSRLRREARRRE